MSKYYGDKHGDTMHAASQANSYDELIIDNEGHFIDIIVAIAAIACLACAVGIAVVS